LGQNVERGREDGEFSRGNHGAASISETGEPVIFYHGTADDIQAGFDLEHSNRKDFGWIGNGVYVANDPLLAKAYAYDKVKVGNARPNIMPLFAAVKNPYYASLEDKGKLKHASKSEILRITKEMQDYGHDGA